MVVETALAGPGQHSWKFPLAAAKLTLSQAPKSFFIQTFSDGHGLQATVGEPGCFPLLAPLRPLFQLFTGTDLPKVEAVGAGPMSIPGGHAFHEASLGGPYFSLVEIWPLYLSILSFSAQKSITCFPSSPESRVPTQLWAFPLGACRGCFIACYRQTGFYPPPLTPAALRLLLFAAKLLEESCHLCSWSPPLPFPLWPQPTLPRCWVAAPIQG